MDIAPFFVTNAQAFELMQQCYRLFDHIAIDTQATAVFGSSFGNHGPDMARAQFLTVRFGIIAPVSQERIRFSLGAAGLAPHGRDGIDKRQELGYIVAIGRGGVGGQGRALAVSENMMFRTVFPAIYRAGASICPPKTARTELLSATTRDQSSCSAYRKRSKRTRWISSQTPASCHSDRRRQSVMPEQPISLGKSSQGIPVLSTKRMPRSAMRLFTRLRPGKRKRRFTLGSKGSTSSHSSSGTSSRAMFFSLINVLEKISAQFTVNVETKFSFC